MGHWLASFHIDTRQAYFYLLLFDVGSNPMHLLSISHGMHLVLVARPVGTNWNTMEYNAGTYRRLHLQLSSFIAWVDYDDIVLVRIHIWRLATEFRETCDRSSYWAKSHAFSWWQQSQHFIWSTQNIYLIKYTILSFQVFSDILLTCMLRLFLCFVRLMEPPSKVVF